VSGQVENGAFLFQDVLAHVETVAADVSPSIDGAHADNTDPNQVMWPEAMLHCLGPRRAHAWI
jgi:hypothetical protein